MDAITYENLRAAGLTIAEEACIKEKTSLDKIWERAGCPREQMGRDTGSIETQFSGKFWDRLMTYCTTPEQWLKRAKVLPPKGPDYVSKVLGVVSEFYCEATQRFLAATEGRAEVASL